MARRSEGKTRKIGVGDRIDWHCPECGGQLKKRTHWRSDETAERAWAGEYFACANYKPGGCRYYINGDLTREAVIEGVNDGGIMA